MCVKYFVIFTERTRCGKYMCISFTELNAISLSAFTFASNITYMLLGVMDAWGK
jgi:hypothetical protein